MKKIIILGSVLLIIIITIILSNISVKGEKYFDNIANIVVGFYQSSYYDSNEVKDDDIPAINKYITTLTHVNHEINISEFIKKEELYYTNESNSKEIYLKDSNCYVKYDDIKKDLTYDKNESIINYEKEPYKRLVCNKYYTVLYESDFYPDYEITKQNKKYNYIFYQKYEKENSYEYLYRSTFDRSGLLVILSLDDKTIVQVNTKFVNVSDYS